MKSDNKHRYSPDMHVKVRKWIVEVLEERKSVIALPVEQRAKFEGWLKFELAYHASKVADVRDVKVEVPVKSTDKQNKKKVTLNDISFCFEGNNYRIELKTSNTNYECDYAATLLPLKFIAVCNNTFDVLGKWASIFILAHFVVGV